VALRSKWAAGKAVRAGVAVEGAYLDRYVTEEQRSRRPIFIATLRAARLLTDYFVAHRSKTTAGILPLRFAHPAKIRSSATTPATDWVHYGETVRRFGVSAVRRTTKERRSERRDFGTHRLWSYADPPNRFPRYQAVPLWYWALAQGDFASDQG